MIVENPAGGQDKPDLRLKLFWYFGGILKNSNIYTYFTILFNYSLYTDIAIELPTQIHNFKFTEVPKPGVSSSEQLTDADIDAIDVEWQSRGATVIGLHQFDREHNWSDETKHLVMFLNSLKDDKEVVTVKFGLPQIIQDV